MNTVTSVMLFTVVISASLNCALDDIHPDFNHWLSEDIELGVEQHIIFEANKNYTLNGSGHSIYFGFIGISNLVIKENSKVTLENVCLHLSSFDVFSLSPGAELCLGDGAMLMLEDDCDFCHFSGQLSFAKEVRIVGNKNALTIPESIALKLTGSRVTLENLTLKVFCQCPFGLDAESTLVWKNISIGIYCPQLVLEQGQFEVIDNVKLFGEVHKDFSLSNLALQKSAVLRVKPRSSMTLSKSLGLVYDVGQAQENADQHFVLDCTRSSCLELDSTQVSITQSSLKLLQGKLLIKNKVCFSIASEVNAKLQLHQDVDVKLSTGAQICLLDGTLEHFS